MGKIPGEGGSLKFEMIYRIVIRKKYVWKFLRKLAEKFSPPKKKKINFNILQQKTNRESWSKMKYQFDCLNFEKSWNQVLWSLSLPSWWMDGSLELRYYVSWNTLVSWMIDTWSATSTIYRRIRQHPERGDDWCLLLLGFGGDVEKVTIVNDDKNKKIKKKWKKICSSSSQFRPC